MNIATFSSPTVPTRTKWAFTTRRVVRTDVAGLSTSLCDAVSGDLVLGQIMCIGHHKNIQLASGRSSKSYVGDLVVLACGDRYAPDQFEGLGDLDPELADLLAGGGVLGRMRQAHAKMAAPTQVKPVGLLVDRDGEIINLGRYALPIKSRPTDLKVVGVVGTSMNAGKTTTAASLAHGLSRAGYRVAAVKATGTGAFGDFNAFRDAGVPIVVDFTDAGMASTYRQPLDRIEQGFDALVAHAAEQGADIVVAELADGIFQEETAELLRSSTIRDALSGIVLAASDAVGLVGGVSHLRQIGLEPLAASGLVTASPLAAAEAGSGAAVTIISCSQLCDPTHAVELLGDILPFETRSLRKVA